MPLIKLPIWVAGILFKTSGEIPKVTFSFHEMRAGNARSQGIGIILEFQIPLSIIYISFFPSFALILKAIIYQSQSGGPRGVSPWVKALPAGRGGLLAT
jgi:hypothetical protein